MRTWFRFTPFKRALTVGALFVITIGAFVAVRHERQAKRDAFVKSFQESQTLLKSDNPEALKKLEQTIMFSASPEEVAAAKVSMGVGYISGKDFEGLKKGIIILKEAAANEAYPPYYRAGAITYAAGIYPSSLDAAFAKRYIFSGDSPWGSFIKDGGMDVAVRLAYEWANSIFPTARASYNIALWYGNKLLEDSTPASQALSSEQRAVYANLFKTSLREGNSLLEVIVSRGTLSRDAKELAFLFQLRGVSHALDYELHKTFNSKNVAETSFKLALATLDEDPAISQAESTRGLRLFIDYYYAAFLAHLTVEQVEDRKTDARRLLGLILDEPNRNFPFFSYLKNLGAMPLEENSTAKENAKTLTRLEPRFRALLAGLGWKM